MIHGKRKRHLLLFVLVVLDVFQFERSALNVVLAASKDWTFETWINLEQNWRKKSSELGQGKTKRERYIQEGNLLRIDVNAEIRVLRVDQIRLQKELTEYQEKVEKILLEKGDDESEGDKNKETTTSSSSSSSSSSSRIQRTPSSFSLLVGSSAGGGL